MSREILIFAVICSVWVMGCGSGGSAQPPLASSREGGREATPASFNSTNANPIPSTQPVIAVAPTTAAASDLAADFDAALLGMLKDEPAAPNASLPADERQLIASVIDSLAHFRHGLRDAGNTTMAARVAPLVDLSDRVHAQSPLTVPTLAICKSVTQFGAYDEYENASFPAGKETATIVYCEIENFSSRQADPGRWETKLSYEAALYDAQSADRSTPVWSKKPTEVIDECRNRRRDFFLADRFTIPPNLPVGRYILKVTVIDTLANHVAEKSVPITMTSN
jgi:hypothetical protein